MSDFRVKVTVRNARLLRAIEATGETCGHKFADKIGITYTALHLYVTLKKGPYDRNGNLRSCAEKLCVALNMGPDDLWDDIPVLEKNSGEVELSADDTHALLEGNNPMEALAITDQRQAIDAALGALPKRQANVIRMRMGFDGDPMTLKEVGDFLGITQERVRQIEATGLRKLRHPKRSDPILDAM